MINSSIYCMSNIELEFLVKYIKHINLNFNLNGIFQKKIYLNYKIENIKLSPKLNVQIKNIMIRSTDNLIALEICCIIDEKKEKKFDLEKNPLYIPIFIPESKLNNYQNIFYDEINDKEYNKINLHKVELPCKNIIGPFGLWTRFNLVEEE